MTTSNAVFSGSRKLPVTTSSLSLASLVWNDLRYY